MVIDRILCRNGNVTVGKCAKQGFFISTIGIVVVGLNDTRTVLGLGGVHAGTGHGHDMANQCVDHGTRHIALKVFLYKCDQCTIADGRGVRRVAVQ